jgi:DNA/RNA-binding domain of Phe-tRNA-synthetase-like protein
MEYQVEIIETLSKLIKVSASNEDMAKRIVRDRYFDEEIVLDSGDFVSVEFKNIEE